MNQFEEGKVSTQQQAGEMFACAVVPCDEEIRAQAEYRSTEYSIACEVQKPSRGPLPDFMAHPDESAVAGGSRSYLICDTLTLILEAESGELLGFDAYTNKAKWDQSGSLEAPQEESVSTLRITAQFEDDRESSDMPPVFRYDKQQNLLRIDLQAAEPAASVRLGSDLYAGISESGQLCRLYCSNLNNTL